jgi:BASS family bile acid:Na+ symporter
MGRLKRFVKDWALPIVMGSGVAAYFLFSAIGFSAEVRHLADKTVGIVQPALLFCMLYISFCKIDPSKIRPRRWHLWLALIQSGTFAVLALVAHWLPNGEPSVIVECAMVCMICPTATAAVVVTDKLGGNTLSLVGYTIVSNVVAALVIPAIVPFVNPGIGMNFAHSFFIIIKQVFPLLVFPFLLAWVTRLLFPRFLQMVLAIKDLAFYLWMVALALAMTVTTRAIVHSGLSAVCFTGMLAVTLVCCGLQFGLGKLIGGRYADRISGGQAMGQKNTVFIIWVAYTFLNPVVAVAGGLYSIWHNTVNSWQLYRRRRASRDS